MIRYQKKGVLMILRLALYSGFLGVFSLLFLDHKVAQLAMALEIRTTTPLRLFTFLFSPAFHIIGSTLLAGAAYFFAFSLRLPLYMYATAQILSGTIVQFGKNLIGRARPLIGGDFDPYILMPITFASEYHSLPSGHACVCATLGTLLAFAFPKYRVPILIGTLVLPLIRVLQMKHFLSDVCLGLCIGFLITQMTISFFAHYLELIPFKSKAF